MAVSGTQTFSPPVYDLVIEAYERIGIYGTAIDTTKIISARRSANLLLQDWSNKGVNLWCVDQIVIPVIKGVATYPIDPATINLLDCYLRQFELGPPTNLAPAFTTTLNSTLVTVAQKNHGLSAGLYIDIPIPVAIGGLTLLGFYQVNSVVDPNTYTIVAGQAAPIAAGPAGSVPVFTATVNSPLVSVAFPAHGLVAGQNFQVEVLTSVGGLALQGVYPVTSVTDVNTFVITVPFSAGSNGTASENGGLCQISAQLINVDPIDIPMYPLSRNEYAMLPDKVQQGRPTSFWFDRTLAPTISIWPLSDGSIPYEFRAYRMRQIDDANPLGPQTLDAPNRFLEAFCAELAWKLAIKWKPEMAEARKVDAKEAWAIASGEDREKVPLFIAPDFSSYF